MSDFCLKVVCAVLYFDLIKGGLLPSYCLSTKVVLAYLKPTPNPNLSKPKRFLRFSAGLTAAKNGWAFPSKRRHIYTRTAPNLFLTKTNKLSSHGTSHYLASPLTLYGRLRQLYTRRNQRAFCILEDFGTSFLPQVPITSSSFCIRINLLSSNNLFGAKLRRVRQACVFSWYVCSRGFAGARILSFSF